MQKEIRLANYCERCKIEHGLPECANFLFFGECEICGVKGLTYFHGGFCFWNIKK